MAIKQITSGNSPITLSANDFSQLVNIPYLILAASGGGTIEVNLPSINSINKFGQLYVICEDGSTTVNINTNIEDVISEGGVISNTKTINGDKAFVQLNATTYGAGNLWLGSTNGGGGGGGGGAVILLGNGVGSSVRCGQGNNASGACSTVSGGYCNTASCNYSTVSGGYCNTALGNNSTVGGGKRNTASGDSSTLSGGYCNTSSGAYSTVSGGNNNTASSYNSTVSGGICNTSSNQYSTVSGGTLNTASGYCSTVSGGYCNTASCYASTVSGGTCNTSSCNNSTVGGGCCNTASGRYSTISGGYNATAYLYGQQANANGFFSAASDSQVSTLISRREATLNNSDTAPMSLDGTGVTNLIIPQGNNRAWQVSVEWVIICTVLGTGTSGSLAVGRIHAGLDAFYFKRVNGVSSISAITNAHSKNDAGMASSRVNYSVGGSNDLLLTLEAPTTAGTASSFRANAVIRLTELAW